MKHTFFCVQARPFYRRSWFVCGQNIDIFLVHIEDTLPQVWHALTLLPGKCHFEPLSALPRTVTK